MTEMPEFIVLRDKCTGPNAKCRKASRNGHTVHIIPKYDTSAETLIPTTYHFESVEIGMKQLEREWNESFLIETDEQLIAARRAGIAHRLPIGWIDPEMRR